MVADVTAMAMRDLVYIVNVDERTGHGGDDEEGLELIVTVDRAEYLLDSD